MTTPITTTVTIGNAILDALIAGLPAQLTAYGLILPNADTGYRYGSPLFEEIQPPCVMVDPDDWENQPHGIGKQSNRHHAIGVWLIVTGPSAPEIKKTLDSYGDLACKVLEDAWIAGSISVKSLVVTKGNYYALHGVKETTVLRALQLIVEINYTRQWGTA